MAAALYHGDMSRRARFLAALAALTALTLSFTESVWASTCAPGMSMETPAAAVSPSSDPSPDRYLCGPEHEHLSDHDSSNDGRPCPFSSPAAAQMCSGVTSAPAQPMIVFASWSQEAPAAFTIETRHDLLLKIALFRPPRA